MTPVDPGASLPPAHQKALSRAVDRLENAAFAKRLAEFAGQPIDRALLRLPRPLRAALERSVEKAVLRCLQVALTSLKSAPNRAPKTRLSTLVAGVSGGFGGVLGAAGLTIELPLTTILMLRAIADIAHHHGEDLSTLEARLACVEVFALGAGSQKGRSDVGYYASRAMLARASSDAVGFVAERGLIGASTPIVGQFVGEVSARFGLVVSERLAASALPIVGALGGAAANAIFMHHFQELAHGHFVIRRLERIHGRDVVERSYSHISNRVRPAAFEDS